MNVTVSVKIDAAKDIVWKTITDIEHCDRVISSIIKVKVLEKSETGLAGLRWQETREMFGKEATETMWITDAVANEFYATRAESYGSVYLSRLDLQEQGSATLLSMSFSASPQTLVAKILSFVMSPMIKGSLKKEIARDLADIKQHIETS
ncbi:MAG: SRPBCC family protein [Gammaproteobacteria bacterium]|nr:SRPBCC family protein [Gammaproteobacteria bacterium]